MEYKESKEAKKRSEIGFRTTAIRFKLDNAKKLNKKMTWYEMLIGFIDTNYPDFKENHYVQDEEYSVGYQFADYISKRFNVSAHWMYLKEQLIEYIDNKLEELK